MMQWTKGDTGFEAKESTPAAETTPDERMGPGLLFAQVIQSLALALSRVGVSSLAILLFVAVAVASIVFGLTANEAAAFGNWCRGC